MNIVVWLLWPPETDAKHQIAPVAHIKNPLQNTSRVKIPNLNQKDPQWTLQHKYMFITNTIVNLHWKLLSSAFSAL